MATREEEIALGNLLIDEIKKFHGLTAAFVMDMESYRTCRSILMPNDIEDPDNPWVPVEGDMIQGYPLVVREGGGEPHIELVERPLRPAHYAGMTSMGIERPMKEPEALNESKPAEGVDPGREEAAEADGYATG